MKFSISGEIEGFCRVYEKGLRLEKVSSGMKIVTYEIVIDNVSLCDDFRFSVIC